MSAPSGAEQPEAVIERARERFMGVHQAVVEHTYGTASTMNDRLLDIEAADDTPGESSGGNVVR